MITLTLRLQENKHARPRQWAESQGVSMNRLMDELATIALAQPDAEIRFRARAGRWAGGEGAEGVGSVGSPFGGGVSSD